MSDETQAQYSNEQLEEMVLAAIEGDSGFPLEVDVMGAVITPVIRWPTRSDETRITVRAAEIGQLPPDLQTNADFAYAHGMAMLETLCVAPFPESWVKRGWVSQDRVTRQPSLDLERLPRAVAVAAWIKYNELQTRFLKLAL